MTRVAINGFGRIGRGFMRAALGRFARGRATAEGGSTDETHGRAAGWLR